MLIPRDPMTPDQNLTSVRAPWRQLLTDHEQAFLTDNQLSVIVDKQGLGCEQIHFYPLPFAHHFAGGRWDFEEMVNHDCLHSNGPRLSLPVEPIELTFRPDRIEKTLGYAGNTLRERCAVSGNRLLIEWDLPGVQAVPLQFGLPYFATRTEPLENGLLISVQNQVFVALVLEGAGHVDYRIQNEPFECQAQVPLTSTTLRLALACGYDRDAVVAAATQAARDAQSIFNASEEMWDAYFSRVVPRFACSDQALEKLYYYQAYTTRANLYDIPYEPFTHPYTCPWKTGAVWQWSWNTPMNAIAERWLNDKRIGAGGILLEADNGGGLNIGSWLHPLQKVTALREHNAQQAQMSEYLQAMPDGVDLLPLTTLPHTTPNGLLGAWEFYLCHGNRDFLRQTLALMREAEALFSQHALENGLCTCLFIDEFDYSLRLKPFVSRFSKGDTQLMFKMDTPFIAVDYNCYLYALRERMIQAAELLGDDLDVARLRASNEQLKAAINQYLWSEPDGFYYDTDPRTMQHSGVKCIGAFAALYAGVADERQAARLVKHLTNPAEFGTPYPCPSISMDTPDVDPELITYGGDCLMSSGLWFTVEGLVRYGYRDLAAQYILKAVEMVNQEGPSSSYSYHSITGHFNQGKHTLASQCTILTDLICRHIIGLHPSPEGDLTVDALALDRSSLQSFTFGPYAYRGQRVTVQWERENNTLQLIRAARNET